jgi:PAS domain S-box-containing protein
MKSTERRRAPLYLIPILLGMVGVLFAQQIEVDELRVTIILVSIAMPIFAGGNVLGHLQSRGLERIMILAGLALLCIGALVTAAGLSESLTRPAEVPGAVMRFSHWLGLASLFAGTIGLLWMLVRREEDMGEIYDRFRLLAKHMAEGFALVGRDDTILLVNQRMLDMFGLPEREVAGHKVESVAKRLKMGNLDLLPSMDEHDIDAEHQLNWMLNGEERHYSLSRAPVRDRRGDHAGVIFTLRDVTDSSRLSQRLEKFAQGLQKLVEDRTHLLRQSEERLRDLLLNMNEGFITVDENYHINFANERMGTLLGRSPEELLSQDIFALVKPSHQTKLYESFDDVKASNMGQVSRELAMKHARGMDVPVFVAISPIVRAEEGGDCFSLVVTDIVILKDMQRQLMARADELERANEELRTLDRAKDVFLTNVTHELRTPLSTVRGYLEMFESGNLGTLDESQTSAIQVVGRNVHRLGTLIDEMIDFSRMEIRGVRLNLSLFDLRKLAEECAKSIQPDLSPKQITVHIDAAPGHHIAWGDRTRLAQVISVLMSNAVKFSNDGGSITIRIEDGAPAGKIISVADTGIGIDGSHQARVFEKFFQVDSSMNRRYEGAGIGLSIANSIVDAHGGDITLDSAPGKGSTFSVVLPRSAFHTALPPNQTERIRIHSLRALIVANDADFVEALSLLVTSMGGEVCRASSGYEALRAAKEFRPDIILMVDRLSELGGEELADKLMDSEELEVAPIALLTDTQSLDEEPRIQDGTIYPLVIPFNAIDVLALVHTACLNEDFEAPVSISDADKLAATGPAVVVIDEDPEFIEWVRGGLQRKHISCYASTSAAEGLDLVHRYQPDCIILDVDSDIIDGWDTLGILLDDENTQAIPVYALSCLPPAQFPVKGCAGSLRKPFKMETLMTLIHDASRSIATIHQVTATPHE